MKDEADPRLFFWPYDIFGYLIPGFIIAFALVEFNENARALFKERFTPSDVLDIATLVGISYVFGHIVAALSSLLLENAVLKLTHGYPGYQFFTEYKDRCCLHRFFYWLQLLIPGYCEPYSEELRRRLRQVFRQIYGYDPIHSSKDLHSNEAFWMISNHITVSNKSGFRVASHFLELYGFSRNTSMSLFLIAWLPWLPGWQLSIGCVEAMPRWIWATACIISSIVMYRNYTKLFRRHNDHIFKSFVACQASNPPTLLLP